MATTRYGIRVVGTQLLFWGPDHLRRFKPWPTAARGFDTQEEAQERAETMAQANAGLNAEHPHLEPGPTQLEVVRIVTEVLPMMKAAA
jgi:hypothetical protein